MTEGKKEFCIVECYVCRQPVAVPPNVDEETRWVHVHCAGNTPTVSELVVGFLAAFARERFCVDCLARRIGLSSRKAVDDALGTLADRIRVSRGECARCSVTTQVVAMSAVGASRRQSSNNGVDRDAIRRRSYKSSQVPSGTLAFEPDPGGGASDV